LTLTGSIATDGAINFSISRICLVFEPKTIECLYNSSQIISFAAEETTLLHQNGKITGQFHPYPHDEGKKIHKT